MSSITEPVLLVPERRRYEMNVAGQVAFIDYRREGRIIALTHAEVPAALNGRGIGSALVRGTLEQIKAAGDQVGRCARLSRPIWPSIPSTRDCAPIPRAEHAHLIGAFGLQAEQLAARIHLQAERDGLAADLAILDVAA